MGGAVVTDTIRGAMFACACAAFIVLLLMGIAYHNSRMPWPEQDNPTTQEGVTP